MKVLVITVVILLISPLQSVAATYRCNANTYQAERPVPCSATWQFAAKCTGNDLIWDWKVSGQTEPPDPFVTPWLDYAIDVIGYELTILPQRYGWFSRTFLANREWFFMVGSMIQPDAMLWLSHGETRTARFWPSGTAQPWPPKQNAKPVIITQRDGKPYAATGDLIDVHGVCYGGKPIVLLLTIYYTDALH